MKIEKFEILEESEKAWQIEKSIFPHKGITKIRWIPKSVSKMNEDRTIIHIDDWFYNLWLKEIEQEAKNFEKLQIAKKDLEISRKVLKETESYKEAIDFIRLKISDTGLSSGLSNTRTIYYLGEFAKYIFSEKKDKSVLIFNHRLQDLLKSNNVYKNAHDFIKSKIVSVLSPKEVELSFLMAEFKKTFEIEN